MNFPLLADGEKVTVWASSLVSVLKAQLFTLRESTRDNVQHSLVVSDTIGTGYAEVTSVDLKSSGGLVRIDFGCSPDLSGYTLKLVRDTVDLIEVTGNSSAHSYIDTIHGEGAINYSLEIKDTTGGTLTDMYLIATEYKGI